jgi:quercetin dioxygenase-like cupin family protein
VAIFALMKALAACAYAIFSQGGHVESHASYPHLLSLINQVTPEMLRIRLPPSNERCYYEYVSTNVFTMCAFVFKKGTFIPLHDHPRMTVLR